MGGEARAAAALARQVAVDAAAGAPRGSVDRVGALQGEGRDPRVEPVATSRHHLVGAVHRSEGHGQRTARRVLEPLPWAQHRLLAEGFPGRVYVPYGSAWYPYLTRRLAERPANLALFLRALPSAAREAARSGSRRRDR